MSYVTSSGRGKSALLQGLLEDRRFSSVVLSILAFSLLVIGADILILWSHGSPAQLNSVANVIAGLVGSIIALRVWLSNSETASLNRFWGLMALGLVLWTIAEGIWLALGVGSSEVPFPSIADVFWVVGYIPMLAALIMRDRQFLVQPTELQRRISLLLTVFFIALIGFYAVWPSVTAFDSAEVLASLLNLAYPLGDLFILILISRIVFSLGTGRFSLTWQLLGAGFLLFAITDLMFSYADSIGIYYPGGHANLFSLALDVLYFNSYLLIAVGVFAFGLMLEMDRGVKLTRASTPFTRSSVLILVNQDDQIVSHSRNLLSLVGAAERRSYRKIPLTEALGIEASIVQALHGRVVAQASVSNEALKVLCADGLLKDAWLTACAVYAAPQQFTGMAIVLRTNLDNASGAQPRLTPEEQLQVETYLSMAGTRANEEKDILQTYFLEQIRLLVSVIRLFSGANIASGLAEHINSIAVENGMRVAMQGQEITFPEEYDAQKLGETLAPLLSAAAGYAADATSAVIVADEMQRLDQGVKPDAMGILDRFGLRGVATI